MYQAAAAALGLTAVIARVSLGYGPLECCAPPPCGCEPIVCCDPCAGIAAEPAAHAAPGTLPAPAKRATPTAPTPAEEALPPRTNNAFPSAPNLNSPAPAKTPQPTLPADESAMNEVAEAETDPTPPPPTTTETTPPPAATEEPQRYNTPPAEEPAATSPATDPYAELFPADPAISEEEIPAADAPATEDGAPAESTPPASNDEPSATEKEPRTPDYNELFPPSSAIDVLSAPGGLASDSPRPWTNIHGHLLLTARVTKVTPSRIVVTCEDGMSHALAYSELSKHDLRFVRRQVDARQVQLAHEARQKELLADQGR